MEHQSRVELHEEKRTYWKQHVESWRETGLTQAEYCRRHNLKHHQLVYWKKRVLETETAVSFFPLKLEGLLDIPSQTNRASLCLVINDRFKIEVGAGFDAHVLRQLIFALRAVA